MEKRNLEICGKKVNLRLATREDLPFLFDLRKKANKENTVHGISDYKAHEEWFERYLARDNDFLFVARSTQDDNSVGSIAVVDVDFTQELAEVGRWLMMPRQNCGVEVLFLGYRVAIELLGMKKIYFTVLERNSRVIRFHKSTGAKLDRQIKAGEVPGFEEDGVEFSFTIDEWPKIKRKYLAFMRMQ